MVSVTKKLDVYNLMSDSFFVWRKECLGYSWSYPVAGKIDVQLNDPLFWIFDSSLEGINFFVRLKLINCVKCKVK